MKSLKRWIVLVLCLMGTPNTGCAILQLPFALVQGVISIVAIPINLALSMIGPAANAAATAAPYAMLFAQRQGETDHWNLLLVQNTSGLSPEQFEKAKRQIARDYAAKGYAVASLCTQSRNDTRALLEEKHAQCYLAKI